MRILNFKAFMDSPSENILVEFVNAVIDSVDESTSSSSFSTLYSVYRQRDPEADFKDIQSEMDSRGFTIDIIKKIFKKVKFEEAYSHLDSLNGYIDIYMYKIAEMIGSNTVVWLGGEDWAESMDDTDEALIRYDYGCHRTKYGKLLMKQMGVNIQELLKVAGKTLDNFVNDHWDVILKIDNRMHCPWYDEFLTGIKKTDMNDYFFVDDGRVHIFLDELARDVSNVFGTKKTLCKERIVANALVIFNHWESDVTDDEIVIWLN